MVWVIRVSSASRWTVRIGSIIHTFVEHHTPTIL